MVGFAFMFTFCMAACGSTSHFGGRLSTSSFLRIAKTATKAETEVAIPFTLFFFVLGNTK